MERPKYTEQEYNEWVDKLLEMVNKNIMIFYHKGLFDGTTCLLTCGGENFDVYLSDEEYENIKRIFDKRKIEYKIK
jgi:hypothetical protein